MKRIIKFEKQDCAPCKMLSEYLDNNGVSYERINAFDRPELAAKFRVRSLPTLIVLDQDQEVARSIGFKVDELKKLLAEAC